MIKLVILDFDGTLADTREIIVRTNQEAQRRMGYPVTDEAGIVATIGLPLWECILTMYPQLSREDLPAWIKTYREVFESLRETIIPVLFPHVKETLESLCRKGCLLTVASSRGVESLHSFLHDMGVEPYFSYVLGAEDVTHGKPHPEAVLKTMENLSFSPAETLVVGDMPVDIQMGLGAGAHTCGVTFGNSNREALLAAGAHWVIDDFGDLQTIPLYLPR